MQLSNDVFACRGDVATVFEAECLKIRTLSSYFHHAGVCDVAALVEVEFLEVRTSSCYFQHTGISDVAAALEIE